MKLKFATSTNKYVSTTPKKEIKFKKMPYTKKPINEIYCKRCLGGGW